MALLIKGTGRVGKVNKNQNSGHSALPGGQIMYKIKLAFLHPTETITVPPEAAHTEVVESLPSTSTNKAQHFLSNFGIKMLPEEDDNAGNLCF